MKVGILTGGGDVPGLNPAIKAATTRLIGAGHEMVGIRKGWGGLLNFDTNSPASPEKYTLKLDPLAVRKIDRTGGTFLHSSRTNPSNVRAKEVPEFLRKSALYGDGRAEKYDFTPHVLNVLQTLGLKALIAIGGDDTLSYALRLHREGFPVVAIPKTMDNDVRGTDYCIGFSTAMTRSVEFINNMRTAVGSHERIAVIELFGRNSGETSLIASYLAQTDRCIISEVSFDPERVARLLAEDKKRNPSNYAICTISEGAVPSGGAVIESGEEDAYGHKKLGGVGEYLAEKIKTTTGEGIMYQNVAYLMRSGEPDALDKMVGFNFGTLAADLLMQKRTGLMVALQKGSYTTAELETLGGGARPLDVDALYDREQYKPRVKDLVGKPMFLY
jgi:6-phosphofructokinase 1